MDRREAIKAAGAMASAIATIPPAVATQWREQLDGPPSYDPVAVLEAMRERGFSFSLEADGYEGAGYEVVFDGTYWNLYHDSIVLPDFTSAVRWLHQQAAAADKTFAEKWPVPE